MSSYSQFLGASAVGYDFPFLGSSSTNRTVDLGHFHDFSDHNAAYPNYGMSLQIMNTMYLH